MTSASEGQRVDTASRIIKAPPRRIYQAWMDPEALMAWLPPKGMQGQLLEFDPQEDGRYQMALTYQQAEHAVPGKSSEHTDRVRGKFLHLVPNEQIVQLVEFESEDPSFTGTMNMTWTLRQVSEGTEVTIRCENVPSGIRKEDHEVGLRESLENLAAFTE